MQDGKREQVNESNVIELANYQGKSGLEEFRQQARREELARIVGKLGAMFRDLHNEVVIDRERALAMISEYSGILESICGEINEIRDYDLGGKLNSLAEKLERGLSFLCGYLTVVGVSCEGSENTWVLDRAEIRSAVYRTWQTARLVGEALKDPREVSEIGLSEAA